MLSSLKVFLHNHTKTPSHDSPTGAAFCSLTLPGDIFVSHIFTSPLLSGTEGWLITLIPGLPPQLAAWTLDQQQLLSSGKL